MSYAKCSTPNCNNLVPWVKFGNTVVDEPFCEACQGLIEEDAELRFWEHVKDAEREAALNRMHVPKRYRSKTFANFEINERNREAYEATTAYAEGFEVGKTSRGLLMVGPSPSGKTHLATAALKVIGVGYVCKLRDYMADLRASYGHDEDRTYCVDEARTTPLLLLDDLGSEALTSRSKSWYEEIVYTLIDQRYEDLLPMMVTTRWNLRDLDKRVGHNSVSRLLDCCDVVHNQDQR